LLPSEYLSKKLTPYRLPTKDRGVLRTINDACGYMLAMPKRRKLGAPWKYPGGYSWKKRVQQPSLGRSTSRCRWTANLMLVRSST
jgi:hypothetical protein